MCVFFFFFVVLKTIAIIITPSRSRLIDAIDSRVPRNVMDGYAYILISFINTQHNNMCSRIARPPSAANHNTTMCVNKRN